ncbi:hypothetical protein LY28_03376 [Ruminiclostridium sufflavum DSM 19573]|uniref:Uncharacterized protein n=1 Tax=Ruminiclostridium sufflavum DSM 19573 TaxID=1121337 RepID=A0A318XKH4_9FIRM|nr:hypothetical protein [Ruminiclostridium sufflavum]PYG85016.1 hypothetical protein LY28_03376 [Ruminiclostridium sufflavum DSM 19573]
MTKIVHQLEVSNDKKKRNSIMLFCLSFLFILSVVIPLNPGTANADSSWRIYVLTPVEQVVSLSNPSVAVPGGRGFMTPQQICILNADGGPVINAPVTFEVSTHPYITSLMRGSYSRKITVYTDSNGIATCANTNSGFLGEGFQIYSEYVAIKQTLQVTASVQGLTPVTFNTVVKTYRYPY